MSLETRLRALAAALGAAVKADRVRLTAAEGALVNKAERRTFRPLQQSGSQWIRLCTITNPNPSLNNAHAVFWLGGTGIVGGYSAYLIQASLDAASTPEVVAHGFGMENVVDPEIHTKVISANVVEVWFEINTGWTDWHGINIVVENGVTWNLDQQGTTAPTGTVSWPIRDMDLTDKTTGRVYPARMGSGSTNSSTWLRGDGVWGAIGIAEVSGLSTALSGKAASVHTHPASDIDSGVLALTRLPVAGDGSVSATSVVRADDSRLSNARTPTTHTHAAADIASGIIATARLGSGTANSSSWLRGDGVWAAPGVTSLAGLSDTTITTPSSGQVLRYNGSSWVNTLLTTSEVSGLFDTTAPAALGSASPGSATVAARRDHVHAVPTAAQVGAEPAFAAGTTAQYRRGDKTWQTLDKTAVGLGSVDNTSDAAKPVSTAQQTALNLKADKTTTVSAGTGLSGGGDLSANRSLAVVYGTTAGTAAQGNDSRLSDARTPTAHTLESHSNVDSAAPTAGDGFVFETGAWRHRPLVKGDVGLGNVDNTADSAKPVSTAQQTALNGKADKTTTISAGTGLTGGGDLSANRSLAVAYGTTAGTAAQGNDSRLSDARTPTAHTHPASDLTATGTRDATTFLRGDNVWATPAGGGSSSPFGLPSYAGARTKPFDPLTGWYNATGKTLFPLRARLNKSTEQRVKIAAIGHSLLAGAWQGGKQGRDDPLGQLTYLLRDQGARINGTGLVFNSNNADLDHRYTSMGTWVRGGTWNFAESTVAGSEATFVSDVPGTVVDVHTFSNTGTLEIRIDGTLVDTYTGPGGNASITRSFTGLADTRHVVKVKATTSTASFLVGINVRGTAGLEISNTAYAGSVALDWIGTDLWTRGPVLYNSLDPHIVIVQLEANEAIYGSANAATYKTRMQTLLTTLRTTRNNAVLMIASPYPPGGGGNGYPTVSRATWDTFLSAEYDLADQFDVPLLDLDSLMGTDASLYGDQVHFNRFGYAQTARGLAAVIEPPSARLPGTSGVYVTEDWATDPANPLNGGALASNTPVWET